MLQVGLQCPNTSKKFGRELQMMRKCDSYTFEPMSNVRKDVFEALQYPTIYNQIETASPEVRAYEVNPTFCEARSKRNLNADNLDYLCEGIEDLCKNPERKFILGYQENPDSLLHQFGCKAEEVGKYIDQAEEKIQAMCKRLQGTNSLVIVCADHGHQDIAKTYSILELEDIQDCLIKPASLESRSISFFVKEERKEEFEICFNRHFQGEYLLYTKEEFLAKKFLGEGKKHPKLDDFLGNYIAIAIGDSVIKIETYLGKEKHNKKATHCGFTANEMEVPFIVIDCK